MNKDIQDIQRLLDRFLEGTSTLDEEKRLADYFRTHEVDEEWSAYKEMFAMFDKGEVEVKEKKSRAIPLWVWFATTAVAASIAIVFFLNNHEGKVPSDAPLTAQVDTAQPKQPQQTQTDTIIIPMQERPTQLKPQDPVRQYHPRPSRPLLAKQTPSVESITEHEEIAEATLPVENEEEQLYASTDTMTSQPLTVEERLEQQITHYMQQMEQIRNDLAVMSEEEY